MLITSRKPLCFIILAFLFSLLGGGCENVQNELSERIKIAVHPDYERPVTFLHRANRQCKKGFVSENSLGIEANPDIPSGATEGGAEDSSSQENDDQDRASQNPVYLDTGRGWFEIALNFENRSCHFLLVDDIIFDIKASVGNERLSSKFPLSSSYCRENSEPKSKDYIYMIPPAKGAWLVASIEDKKKLVDCPEDDENLHSNVSFKKGEVYTNNLIIIVDNLPLPRGGGASSNAGGGNTSGGASSSTTTSGNSIILPKYNVEMTLTGYFTNQYKELVGDFTSEIIRFSTEPQE